MKPRVVLMQWVENPWVTWSLKSFLAVRGSVPYQLADLEQGTPLSPSFFIVYNGNNNGIYSHLGRGH